MIMKLDMELYGKGGGALTTLGAHATIDAVERLCHIDDQLYIGRGYEKHRAILGHGQYYLMSILRSAQWQLEHGDEDEIR